MNHAHRLSLLLFLSNSISSSMVVFSSALVNNQSIATIVCFASGKHCTHCYIYPLDPKILFIAGCMTLRSGMTKSMSVATRCRTALGWHSDKFYNYMHTHTPSSRCFRVCYQMQFAGTHWKSSCSIAR